MLELVTCDTVLDDLTRWARRWATQPELDALCAALFSEDPPAGTPSATGVIQPCDVGPALTAWLLAQPVEVRQALATSLYGCDFS